MSGHHDARSARTRAFSSTSSSPRTSDSPRARQLRLDDGNSDIYLIRADTVSVHRAAGAAADGPARRNANRFEVQSASVRRRRQRLLDVARNHERASTSCVPPAYTNAAGDFLAARPLQLVACAPRVQRGLPCRQDPHRRQLLPSRARSKESSSWDTGTRICHFGAKERFTRDDRPTGPAASMRPGAVQWHKAVGAPESRELGGWRCGRGGRPSSARRLKIEFPTLRRFRRSSTSPA